MNKQTLFSSCPLATKNLENEGHIFSEADEVFVDLRPKILSARREKEQKEEIDSRHTFRAKMDLPPSFPS